ncbi:hypothetical protein SAMN05660690_1212 [Geodermatophilus telluris]|uniref:Uncharacterized protein n=1 Tax=Geodermatophilus telluris TaxID=1190417 RepID=A0A1G6L5Q9_9ACTN|nr:hypothetical protein [Geodermatophilus telluris]SDC38564.1 hypothetical protein SAMN05660690_1212 [Geodermatophilus telluris]
MGLAVLTSVALAITLLVVNREKAAGPSADRAGVGARPFIAYGEDSFFRTPLPDDVPVDPQSSQGIAFIKREDESDHPVIRGVEGDEWGMPFAIGTCEDPVWRFTGDVPQQVAWLGTDGFHAPSWLGDALTLTSDSPLVVIDRCGSPSMPEGMSVWGFAAMPGPRHTIEVADAGAFRHDSNGLDARNPLSDSDLNFNSRGAIPDGMLIRDDLLAWAMAHDGDLGHVLHVFWLETDTSAGFVHPMVGDENRKRGWGPEGIRLRIKPDVDLAARNCDPAGLVVARTLQRYGGYLGDNAGGPTAIKGQQGSALLTRDALSCVTWDDFAFVQRGWDGSTTG